MVSVKKTDANNRISVKSTKETNVFGIKDNLSEYYARQSEHWANSEEMVNGIDYSSKYYAEKSKESANKAEIHKNNTLEAINGFEEKVQVAKADIEQNKINSINAIDNTYSIAVGDIQEKSDEVLTSIKASKAEAIDSINSTKTTIINDIEFVADGEKKEIEDLIDNGKEELKESIGDVKVLTTLEIGDIGIAPLGIDETKGKRRYLNGQLIIQEQYVQFTNKVKSAIELYPSLACTESEWQTIATMTVGGQVGKFVVDNDAGTIRLPKIIMPIQGLTDLSKLAEIVDAGLPNLEGSFGSANASGTFNIADGKLFKLGAMENLKGVSSASASYSFSRQVNFNAQDANLVYGNSNTVQQEQIQYPYFIQVATGAETEDNIINEIELNNPFSLLDYKFSEYELNNLSWLRSNGQYNSKAIYPAVYELLLKIYNGVETKAGVSVKLSTETFTDYDFVLNTSEETFRLPIKVKLASGKAVVGNGMTLGMTNGTQLLGVYGTTEGLSSNTGTTYGSTIGTTRDSSGTLNTNLITVGITTDPTKSGIETSDSDLYLYFYVGETVQNANLINAGRIEEKVASLIPDNSELIASYCMPDYSAGIAVLQSSTTFTAPCAGVFMGSPEIRSSTNSVVDISVNGVLVTRLAESNAGYSSKQLAVLLDKGNVLTISAVPPSSRFSYFYPLKGAN